MKTKTGVIAAGVLTAIVALAGCGDGDTYEYAVSGTVETRQLDYDCPGHLSMGSAAFAISGPKPAPKTVKAPTNSKPRVAAPTRRQSGSSGTTGSSGSGSRKSNGGVKLSKKPSKPQKILTVPRPKYRHASKGCKAEYELFIRSGGDLYEQDVRKVDYDKCSETSKFPACTKN